jgi:hypothetical protein
MALGEQVAADRVFGPVVVVAVDLVVVVDPVEILLAVVAAVVVEHLCAPLKPSLFP